MRYMANRSIFIMAALMLFYHYTAQVVSAKGTAPGTTLTYSAELSYTVNGQIGEPLKTSVAVKVSELIDVSTAWQDATAVKVTPGQSNGVTTFKVTNTGNGKEAFTLTVDTAITEDNFDPAFVSIYLDADNNGIFESNKDSLYVAGTNDPDIPADDYRIIFVLCNIPASGLADGDIGFVKLAAASNTGTGAAGTVYNGQGDGGADAVIGNTGGSAFDTGRYQAEVATVILEKSVTIVGSGKPVAGSTLRYTITATATGNGTASNIVITDQIPANTTYAGNLTLNGSSLTDGANDDKGDYNVTNAGMITVDIGDMTSASEAQTITFDVKINQD